MTKCNLCNGRGYDNFGAHCFACESTGIQSSQRVVTTSTKEPEESLNIRKQRVEEMVKFMVAGNPIGDAETAVRRSIRLIEEIDKQVK